MSNIVSPTNEINYISETKKVFVGRNNNTIYQKFKVDNNIQDTYYFQVVSKNNQLVDLSGFSYEFFGSFIDAKNQMHVVFFSDDYHLDNNVLSFKVNTYTEQYLEYVKVPREIDYTIRKKSDGVDQVILRDKGIAYPSPIFEGQEPTPVVAGFGLSVNGYVMSLTGSVLSGDDSTIAINNNVISYIGTEYSAGDGISIESGVISLTASIPSATSQLTNDSDFITSNAITGFAYTSAIPSATSQLVNDSDFIAYVSSPDSSLEIKYFSPDGVQIKVASGFINNYATTAWVEGKNYLTAVPDTYALKTDIPLSTSQLVNDSDFITSNAITGFAYTSAIPKSTSQLTNDSNFVVSSDLTQYALTSSIPISISQLTNDVGYLNSLSAYSYQNGQIITGKVLYFYPTDLLDCYPDGNNISIVYRGLKHNGGTEDLQDSIAEAITWNSEDFTVNEGDGYVEVSLANSIPLSTSLLVNDSGFITSSELTGATVDNQQKMLIDNTVQTSSFVLGYNKDYDIFVNSIAPTDFALNIKPVSGIETIENGKVATFEQWFKANGSLTGITFDNGLNFIGLLPTSFTFGATQVFTRRIIKNSNKAIQQISYAYLFKELSTPEPNYTPLTFTALENNSSVQLTENGSPDPVTLVYKLNDGAWTSYSVGNTINLNQGDTVAFSGANDHFGVSWRGDNYQFIMAGTIEASGNTMSLMNFSDTCTPHCFNWLFKECTSLIKAPLLPATNLAEGCYEDMFVDCTNLTDGPTILPATTLAPRCYQSMFWDCYALTAAPYIVGSPIVLDAFGNFFYSCSSLSSISLECTLWNTSYSGAWATNVANNGIITKPVACNIENLPLNWTVVNV